MGTIKILSAYTQRFAQVLNFLRPLLNLFIRLYVAQVFWQSGLTKIASFDTTLALFTDEYRVPLLSPELAAGSAIFVELVFPVMLALGAGGRIAAAVLFLFNLVAVISYPDLNEIGLKDHFYWGLLLMIPLVYGPGKLSIDHLLRRHFWGSSANPL